MRIRLPELLKERGLTAYGLAAASKGRIDMSTLYRLTRAKGHVRYLDSQLLDALCDTLDVEPGELLERKASRKGRSR